MIVYDKILKSLIRKLFNVHLKPQIYCRGKLYGFIICSRTLVKYLTEYIGLPLGKKYEKLSMPPLFLKDKRLARNFISGLADTDFHLQIKRGTYPIIAGVSKSEKFIQQVKGFLEEDGFKSCTYKREVYDKRVNKIIITYALQLSGHKQFHQWIEKIGFRHPKVSNKVNFLVNYKKDSAGGI